MGDAAHAILVRDSRAFTGNFCIDEDVLRQEGVGDFSTYLHAGVREQDLLVDFFV
jgi:citronellol/citronellal dehydrogenase